MCVVGPTCTRDMDIASRLRTSPVPGEEKGEEAFGLIFPVVRSVIVSHT